MSFNLNKYFSLMLINRLNEGGWHLNSILDPKIKPSCELFFIPDRQPTYTNLAFCLFITSNGLQKALVAGYNLLFQYRTVKYKCNSSEVCFYNTTLSHIKSKDNQYNFFTYGYPHGVEILLLFQMLGWCRVEGR